MIKVAWHRDAEIVISKRRGSFLLFLCFLIFFFFLFVAENGCHFLGSLRPLSGDLVNRWNESVQEGPQQLGSFATSPLSCPTPHRSPLPKLGNPGRVNWPPSLVHPCALRRVETFGDCLCVDMRWRGVP